MKEIPVQLVPSIDSRCAFKDMLEIRRCLDFSVTDIHAVMPGGLHIARCQNFQGSRKDGLDHCIALFKETDGHDSRDWKAEIIAWCYFVPGTGKAMLSLASGKTMSYPNLRRGIEELYSIAAAENPGAQESIIAAQDLEKARMQAFESFLFRDDVLIDATEEDARMLLSKDCVAQKILEIGELVSFRYDPYSHRPLPYCKYYGVLFPSVLAQIMPTARGTYSVMGFNRRRFDWIKTRTGAWRSMLRYVSRTIERELSGHMRLELSMASRAHPITKGEAEFLKCFGDPQASLFQTIEAVSSNRKPKARAT